MDDKQFEDRMRLLKKSYDRVPSQFQQEEIIEQIEIEKQSQTVDLIRKPRKNRQKLTIWAISIASIFVISILGATFILESDKENNQGGKGQYTLAEVFKDVEKDYPITREKNRKLLKMKEEDFAELDFVKVADSKYNMYKNAAKKDAGKYLMSAKEKANIYDQIIKRIQLPLPLIVIAASNPKKLSESEAKKYISDYYFRTEDLVNYYENLFSDYKEEIKALSKDGQLNEQTIPMNRERLPQELQDAIEGARSQNLHLKVVNSKFVFAYLNDFAVKKLRDKISDRLLGYLTIIEKAPYSYDATLLHPVEETGNILNTIERTLNLVDKEEITFFNAIEYDYAEMAFYFLIGSNEHPVFDKKGKVNQEYRDAWQNVLARSPKYSPLAVYLEPIIRDFQSTNWTTSENWENVLSIDIKKVMENKLKEASLDNFGDEYYEDLTIINSEFESQNHMYLKNTLGPNAKALFKEAKATDIVGLYYNSMRLKHFDTVLELYAKGKQYDIPSEEQIMKNRLESFEDVTRLSDIMEYMIFIQSSTEKGEPEKGIVRVIMKKEAKEDSIRVEEFQLIKEDVGWRILYTEAQ
ncbi:hypothetical protein JFL43_15280 [Viridibacillus sp. YIM B01967]|uniref:Uncharacterized protein n=1 Tax=Viridibacillus soli TaxID=2798301 RepID=A0ABS1HAA1_9BACL|nr:hypothetical protein [Viridibacillus soli]MBK3496199.1 hypothetical protein [Viridibacillus soli]